MSKRRRSSGFQLDSYYECHIRAQARGSRNALLCGSLFLSLCQREIAALGALELHRITQNINMQIAFFREGNFISARKIRKKPDQFLSCTMPGSSPVLKLVRASAAGKLGRTLNLARVLPPPPVPSLSTQLTAAGWPLHKWKGQVRTPRSHSCATARPHDSGSQVSTRKPPWGLEAATLRIRSSLFMWTSSHPFILEDSTRLSHWPQRRARIWQEGTCGRQWRVCWGGIRDGHLPCPSFRQERSPRAWSRLLR